MGKVDFAKAGIANDWQTSLNSYDLYHNRNIFTFLNKTHYFSGAIDWDFKGYGLLWKYNLNYFEFLVQPDINSETAYYLIDDFWNQYDYLATAHDPYPLSLRLIFWIRFFLRQNKQPEKEYLFALHQQSKELMAKIEYHLLGNHILENAFALYFSGLYLNDNTLLLAGKRLLDKQLNEQILCDGAHFELSPMYHQLMLYRLLDIINLTRTHTGDSMEEFVTFLENKASVMLGWMQRICFSTGSFPLFNDAAFGIAPSPNEIFNYAERLHISINLLPLKDSGYRKWTRDSWEMIIDAGQPGPCYQPGHAHCDALSFVLSLHGKPIVVDTGTSAYSNDLVRRKIERSTFAHNTVQIGSLEQSEMWGAFRVARRACVTVVEENENKLTAAHNGFYFSKRNSHIRTFERENNEIIITDKIYPEKGDQGVARIHFHPSVAIKEQPDHRFDFNGGAIYFFCQDQIKRFSYDYAPAFGQNIKAEGLEITFRDQLVTQIILS